MSLLLQSMRQTRRAEVNPLDVSTIISIFPLPIEEIKHTLEPGHFFISPGTFEKPSFTHIGPSSWWKDVGEDQPLLEIPVGSISIANSVVADYCNSMLAFSANAKPGLFFVPGKFTNLAEIAREPRYNLLYHNANKEQKNWYLALVKMADMLWSRTNGNPLAISDNMRLAARELGLVKEWIADFQHVEMVKCLACGSMRNPMYPVCPTCKAVVDADKAKALNLKFAE